MLHFRSWWNIGTVRNCPSNISASTRNFATIFWYIIDIYRTKLEWSWWGQYWRCYRDFNFRWRNLKMAVSRLVLTGSLPKSHRLLFVCIYSFTVNIKSLGGIFAEIRRCLFSSKKFVAANVRLRWWRRLACEGAYGNTFVTTSQIFVKYKTRITFDRL